MTDVATKSWYIVHTYSGFEKKVSESPCIWLFQPSHNAQQGRLATATRAKQTDDLSFRYGQGNIV